MEHFLLGALSGLRSLDIEKNPRSPYGFDVKSAPLGLRFWLAIGFFVFIFTVIAIDQFRKYTEFAPVEARVTKVDQACKLLMEKTDKAKDEKKKSTKFMDCGAAKRLAAAPEWTGAELIAQQEFDFVYTSPVDQKVHQGHRKDTPGSHLVLVKPGQTIKIRASKKKPEETRESRDGVPA